MISQPPDRPIAHPLPLPTEDETWTRRGPALFLLIMSVPLIVLSVIAIGYFTTFAADARALAAAPPCSPVPVADCLDTRPVTISSVACNNSSRSTYESLSLLWPDGETTSAGIAGHCPFGEGPATAQVWRGMVVELIEGTDAEATGANPRGKVPPATFLFDVPALAAVAIVSALGLLGSSHSLRSAVRLAVAVHPAVPRPVMTGTWRVVASNPWSALFVWFAGIQFLLACVAISAIDSPVTAGNIAAFMLVAGAMIPILLVRSHRRLVQQIAAGVRRDVTVVDTDEIRNRGTPVGVRASYRLLTGDAATLRITAGWWPQVTAGTVIATIADVTSGKALQILGRAQYVDPATLLERPPLNPVAWDDDDD